MWVVSQNTAEARWCQGSSSSSYGLYWPCAVWTFVGSVLDTSMVAFVFPAVGCVALLSLLPHKELRFIFAVIPVLNMCAALGMAKWARAWKGGGATLACGALLVVNFALSLVFLFVSVHNYPGGAAFTKLHELVQEEGVTLTLTLTLALTLTSTLTLTLTLIL